METKNEEQILLRIKKRLNFKYSFLVNPVGIAGGLALFWNEEFSIAVESHSMHFIDVVCKSQDNNQYMRATFVHAPSEF